MIYNLPSRQDKEGDFVSNTKAMQTELEELVSFLGSIQPQIRQLALENLVGYSQGSQSSIFTPPDLKPVKHLKVLVADIPVRAKHALTILINLCDSETVIKTLAEDESFVELLISKITIPTYANADDIAMLLANMSKSESFGRLVTLERAVPKGVSDSKIAMDQLMDCFVKGARKSLNKDADFDYLSYMFANLSSLSIGRQYFVTKQAYDDVIPISKLVVFTELYTSNVRRKGVASTIKNCCFDIDSHSMILGEDQVNLLSYILLPLCGSETYSEEDMAGMPEDLQLLPPDKERDPDRTIITTHLESLLLLTTTRPGREQLRRSNVYPIIRETHLAVIDDDVEAACDRLVQVLMRDEALQGDETEEFDDRDDQLVEII